MKKKLKYVFKDCLDNGATYTLHKTISQQSDLRNKYCVPSVQKLLKAQSGNIIELCL
jgi:hypothetical protein